MTPGDFWNSTFDEVLLVIKGKVDDWRIQRMNAWKIVEGFRGSEGMPEVYNFYSLPYDEELVGLEKVAKQDSLEEWYKQASGELDNVKWN